MRSLSDYRRFVPESKISEIYRKARDISNKHIVNVNATYYGGGVAEMMRRMVPIFNEIGIKVGWRSIVGSRDFFQVTKKFHNALQGEEINFTEEKKEVFERVNKEFSKFTHLDHDLVVVHDPQPLPLIQNYDKKQPFVWRCHIDLSDPNEEVWDYLRSFVLKHDKTIYQLEEFSAEDHSNHCDIIHPAIDPLAVKNKDLSESEINKRLKDANIDPNKPIVAQISRYDKWKDPKGALEVYKNLREMGVDCQFVMIGGMATDDPEGQKIYREVEKKADNIEDVNLIVDAPDILVNVVQAAADVILQMSKREGFGLTATEALWKRTPVITTKVGGLQLQVDDGENGYLVEPGNYKKAAKKAADIVGSKTKQNKMGDSAREKVRDNFLITRQIEDWIEVYRDLLLNNSV